MTISQIFFLANAFMRGFLHKLSLHSLDSGKISLHFNKYLLGFFFISASQFAISYSHFKQFSVQDISIFFLCLGENSIKIISSSFAVFSCPIHRPTHFLCVSNNMIKTMLPSIGQQSYCFLEAIAFQYY